MIAERIKIVEKKIDEACTRAGRNRSEITLIAVSKTQPNEAIIEAFNYGIKDFGENKAQEFKRKTDEIKEKITWHFIGHLQTNKVKDVVKSAEFIHSVDSLKLAKEINKRAAKIDKKQKILLEINTSGEESKFGLRNEDEIWELAEFCSGAANLELVGLMTMAPFVSDEETIRNCFRSLKNLKEKLNLSGFAVSELSMGMTNDYEIAIEEGATMLRIGTAIFGSRNY